MPINIDEIAAEVLRIEGLRPQSPEQIREMLESIENVLQDIKTLFCVFDQIDKLSDERRFPWRDRFGELTAFFDRLRPLVGPHIGTKSYSAIIKQIRRLLPRKDKEAEYIRDITSVVDGDPAIGTRAYIPQGFVGLIDLAALGSRITGFSFMATSGIGPCVGYVLFSRAARCCALSHFDDPWGATEIPPKPGTKGRAQNHYNNCIRIILEGARAISGAAEVARDWHVILFPSTVRQSKNLQAMLVEAVRVTGTEPTISEPDATEFTRDFLVELTQLASGTELQPRKYTEVIQFAELPRDLLTLREALHLPTAGFALYHIQEGTLIPQDVNGLFTMVDNYVTQRPLEEAPLADGAAAGAAAPGLIEEAAAQVPAVTSAETVAEIADITAATAPAKLPQLDTPPPAASGVRSPILRSEGAAGGAAPGPRKRARSVDRPVGQPKVDVDTPDTDAASEDEEDRPPALKRPPPP